MRFIHKHKEDITVPWRITCLQMLKTVIMGFLVLKPHFLGGLAN